MLHLMLFQRLRAVMALLSSWYGPCIRSVQQVTAICRTRRHTRKLRLDGHVWDEEYRLTGLTEIDRKGCIR